MYCELFFNSFQVTGSAVARGSRPVFIGSLDPFLCPSLRFEAPVFRGPERGHYFPALVVFPSRGQVNAQTPERTGLELFGAGTSQGSMITGHIAGEHGTAAGQSPSFLVCVQSKCD